MIKPTAEDIAAQIRANPDLRRRVASALAETAAYVEKEGRRSADLRPADVTKIFEFYKAHAEKLRTALDLAA
jgi:hypothetical protein